MKNQNVLAHGTTPHFEMLNEMNISELWFKSISERVLSEYNRTTLNDAVTASGLYAYLAAVRYVREVLKPHGWDLYRKGNLEMAKNSSTGTVIMVSSGDENTGNERGPEPKTKNPKGLETQQIICNNGQMFLWPEYEQIVTSDSESEYVWIYLYHIDQRRKELRSELSLPIDMTVDRMKVSRWQTRIILPKISYDINPAITKPVEYTPEINIEVKRRQNQ